MIIQMLRPAGPDLGRRWLAALLLVPPDEREAVVAEVERRVTALYTETAPEGEGEVHVVHPPRTRGGAVEHVETTYVVKNGKSRRERRQSGTG